MVKNLILGLIFVTLLQENGEKPHFGPNLGPLGPDSGHQISLFKNLVASVTRYQGQLSSCTISEKTNDPILSDRRMDGQTDGKADRRTRAISQDAVRRKSSVQ